jgi:hypothetical protein
MGNKNAQFAKMEKFGDLIENPEQEKEIRVLFKKVDKVLAVLFVISAKCKLIFFSLTEV